MATNHVAFHRIDSDLVTVGTALTVNGTASLGSGAVTQATSNTTGVTLNSSSGTITMFAVMNSADNATFKLTNSCIKANSVVLASAGQAGQNSIDTGCSPFSCYVNNVVAGSCYFQVVNGGGSNSTHAFVIRFIVL